MAGRVRSQYLTGAVVSGPSILVTAARISYQDGFQIGGSTQLGVWRSVDNGLTWSQASGVPRTEVIFALERDPQDDTFLVAVGSKAIYVSTDSGAFFRNTTNGLTWLANTDRYQLTHRVARTRRSSMVWFCRSHRCCINAIGIFFFLLFLLFVVSFFYLPFVIAMV
jgi:hypothetical protein